MQRDLVVVTIAAVVAAVTVCAPPGAEAKLCGSLDIRNHPANLLKLRNCTMVMGYVKILLIDNVDNESAYAEYEFPELTEIAEYLFVFRVKYLTSIGRLFPNLRIIRGRNLFVNNYALVVFHMKYLQEIIGKCMDWTGITDVILYTCEAACYGTKERQVYKIQGGRLTLDWNSFLVIGLHNLYRIERGDIKVDQSPKICFVNTVDWKRIAPKAELHFNQLNEICQSCDPGCNGYCWSSRYCQDVQTDDCHPECLGCTKKNSTSHCKSCKNVMDDNKCVHQCPPGKYVNLYMMKCITRHECTTMMNGTWWIFENQCVRSCPPRYELDNLDKPTSCVYCGDQCVKVCFGARIDSMASLDDAEGCTHINGSLEIVVNDAELYHQLENKLGRLRVIRDKLKIYRSTALKSLHFLNNLTTVEGKELENLRYAIYVYENPNLQTLFNYSDVNFKLEIKSGTVAFHNNPQLCFYEIERLVNITVMNKTGDDIDSFRYSNGDKSTCNEKSFAIRIDESNPTNVTLSWDAQGNDTIGYTVYYTKTKNKNLTAFDSGDQCEKDNVWNSVFVSTNRLKLVELLPYTIYGYYIKTYSTTIWGGEHTPVDYFTTATDDPTEPLDFRVSSWDDTSIHLKWERPLAINGELDHYNFTMLLEEDYWPTVEKRNYCRYPHVDSDDLDDADRQRFETTTEALTQTELNNKAANCSCGAPEPQQEIGIFQVGIGALCRPDSHHNSAECSRLHYNLGDQQVSDFYIGSNFTGAGPDYEEFIGLDKRTGKKGIMERNPRYRNFKLNNPEAQEYIFKDLRYFSLYIFFMRACNKPRTEGSDDYQCSSVVMTFKRTKKKQEVDTITHIEAEAKNRNAQVKWREPDQPNSFLVAYQIEYERKDLEHSKPLTECITRRQFLENGNQYQIKELSPGSYAVRVQAISLAGPGTYTRPVEFFIATKENDFTWLYIVMTIMFVGSVVLSVAYHRYRLKHRVDHLQLIQSINPDYAGPSYEEDEWEIDRNDIEIIKELGKGTFGMVHQGFIKSQNRFCAIKTATDSVSISDRLYFLHEGSVMKGFNDAYHVVKLLGIVSKGQPPYVVMELMDRGDLKSYLRRCREPSQNLTSNEMYRMAAEIADGMAYLAAKKYVHRDLAARNCMVSADRTVKIGDFGMARDIYETDYYRKETVGLLPVRWMAPESLADGVFTTDSDVWSYGVVLWEMATLAEQPYQGLSNEEVFHFVKAKGTLERPNECSDVFFEVMDACWMWRPNDRPTFRDIVNKLSTHVGEDFRLVAFCFSRQGIEHAMNAGPRVFNPPAMVTLPYSSPSPHHHNNDSSAPSTSRNPHYHPLHQHDDPFSIHYDAREEQVGLCPPSSSSRPPQIFPFNSPPHSAVMPSSSNQRTSMMSGAKGGGESPGSPPHSPASYSLGSSY